MPDGLIQQPMQQPVQQPMQAAQQPMQQPMQQSPQKPKRDYQANPPSQKDVDQIRMIKARATKLIHSKETSDKLLSMVNMDDTRRHPIESISAVSISILDRIDQQANQDGEPLDDFAKIHGGNIIVGEVISVLEAAGKIPEMNEDERALAVTHAIQTYSERLIASGDMTREELKQYANEGMAVSKDTGAIDMDTVMGKPTPTMSQNSLSTPEATSTQETSISDKKLPTMSERLASKGGLING